MTTDTGSPATASPEARRLLDEAVIARVATVSRAGLPNVAPFWYHYDGIQVVLYTGDNATVANIRRTGYATVLVDAGSAFGELRGVVMRGPAQAFAHDAAPASVCAAISALEAKHAAEIASPLYAEFQGDGPPATVYVQIVPTSLRHWDFGARIV